MKNCPVCGSVTFDDATVCYGCMHRYGEVASGPDAADGGDTVVVPLLESMEEVPSKGAHIRSRVRGEGCPPGFRIMLMPSRGEAGSITWDCAVELAS